MRVRAFGVAVCLAFLGVGAGCSGGDDPGVVATDSTDSSDATDVVADSSDTDSTDSVVADSDSTDADGTDGSESVDSVDWTDSEDGAAGSDDIGDVVAGEDDTGDDSSVADDATDGVIDADVDEVIDTADVPLDVPDTAELPDIPPTGFELCLLDNKCDDQPLLEVCKDGFPNERYPNDCYYFCQYGDYDGAVPAASPKCQPECTNENCDEADKTKQKLCYHAPGSTEYDEYPNPYAMCCAIDKAPGDAGVLPGACPSELSCGEECAGAGFSPVCGLLDGGLKTFLNACEAQSCEAASPLECPAACPDKLTCPSCPTVSPCAPVCGIDDNTYRNDCYAKCVTGKAPAYEGVCCDCDPPSPDTLVCSTKGTTFGNTCILTCKNELAAYNGPCVDGCTVDPDTDKAACGFYQGAFTKFPNATCAKLSGATCVYEGACSPGTNECSKTNQEYEPVCAKVDGEVESKTYSNPCNAGCAGAIVASQTVCSDCAALCPPADVDNIPHCGPDCVLYPNSCVATKCAGYDLEQLSKNACPVSCSEP